MQTESIKILIVDDDPDDAFVISRYIKKGLQGSAPHIDHAASFTALEARLETHCETSAYDLFLIDYHLGAFTGLDVMAKIRQRGIKAPMILLTGQGDEMIAVAAMKKGASDYLQKDSLSSEVLCTAIRYAMELFQTETLRKKSEKALKRSEEKYRTIINTTTEGYWAFDPDLQTLEVNDALCLMLGYTREEMLSKRPEDLLEEKRRIPFKGAMLSVLVEGHKTFETVLKTKDGQSLHCLFNASTIRSRQGKIRQLFAFVADIRTQKEAEATLKKANEGLKKIDLMKSDFVSNVSHELRTPLTSIKNAIGILATGKAGAFNETQERFLKMAARNIDRLVELVNDVLDLSKLEAGKIQNRPTELKLGILLQNITTLFQAQAKEKGLVFEMDVLPMLPTVYADAARLEQILCNLLSNALKFTPGGGRVALSVKQDGGWITLSVADTGPGLSEADQDRVFDRFYQAGDALGQSIQGTGLGLSISRELVALQGGEIAVESKIGQGCRFFFTLPVFSEKALEMAALEETIRSFPRDSIFSLLVISPQAETEGKRQASEAESFRQISTLIRKMLRSESDLTIDQPAFKRIVCLLPETLGPGAMKVVERLENILSKKGPWPEALCTALPEFREPVFYPPVLYPDDGLTGKALIYRSGRPNHLSRVVLK